MLRRKGIEIIYSPERTVKMPASRIQSRILLKTPNLAFIFIVLFILITCAIKQQKAQ